MRWQVCMPTTFVLHYPGRNPLAGVYHDVGEFLSRLQALIGDGAVHRHLHDALGSEDHSVQMIEVTAEARGLSHAWRAVIVMHVREGKFSEAWFHFDDQHALDDFLNSLARSR